METSTEGPSLAPQWLRGGAAGTAGAGGARRTVKASPADPGSIIVHPARTGMEGPGRQQPEPPVRRDRGKLGKAVKPGGGRVLPPEPFPRKRILEDRAGDRAWGAGTSVTPRSGGSGGGSGGGGGGSFSSFERGNGRSMGLSNGGGSGGEKRGGSPFAGASPRTIPGGRSFESNGVSPRKLGPSGGSYSGSALSGNFGGGVYRSNSAPDPPKEKFGGWSYSQGDRNGGERAWSALVSPTKASHLPSDAPFGKQGDVWNPRLVEMPTSLAAIHTSRSLGAPLAQGLSSSRSEEEKEGQAGVALPRMADAVKQASQAGLAASADEERSRRDVLALQQSKLLVPVVSVAQRERARPKLKGPAPPPPLRSMGGSAGTGAGPRVQRMDARAGEGGARTPPVLGLKGRLLRPAAALDGWNSLPTPVEETAVSASQHSPHPQLPTPEPQPTPVVLAAVAAVGDGPSLSSGVCAEGNSSIEGMTRVVTSSGGTGLTVGQPGRGNQVGPPPGFAPIPSMPVLVPPPLKERNSFLRSLRSRPDSPVTVPPLLSPREDSGDSAGDLATALATACLLTDEDEVAPVKRTSSAYSMSAAPVNGAFQQPPPPGYPRNGMLAQLPRPSSQGIGYPPGFGATRQNSKSSDLGLPAEEEAFLRSLGWSEGAEESGLSEAEIAAYKVRRSFAVR